MHLFLCYYFCVVEYYLDVLRSYMKEWIDAKHRQVVRWLALSTHSKMAVCCVAVNKLLDAQLMT